MFGKTTVVIILATMVLGGCSQTLNQNSKVQKSYYWVELGSDNRQIARAVTTAASCPHIQIDEQTLPMERRDKNGQPKHFEDVISCETTIPANAQSANIDKVDLPLMPPVVQTIVVLGDTGCRMKTGSFQNCNNIPGQGEPWPFAKIAEQIAKAKPDLILHVGDYLYRETPCPVTKPGCAGPYGYNWQTWQADFFEPAAAVLATAPWVFTRGNHEDCNRAWRGWFYFLDSEMQVDDPWLHCQPYTTPYSLELGNLTLVNMDSATLPNANDKDLNPATVAQYRKIIDQVNQQTSPAENSWLITHRPFWAISSYVDWKVNKDKIDLTDSTLQAAVKTSEAGRFGESMKLLLGGHIHNFEALKFNDERPSQMVVGVGGTHLSPPISKQQTDEAAIFEQLGLVYHDFFSDNQFAYALLERQPHNDWLIHLVDVEGLILQSFTLKEKQLERIWE